MRRKKSKLTKLEVLDRSIAAWESKHDGALRMLRKSHETLEWLRKQRRRIKRAADVKAAVVASTIEAPTEPTRVESDIPAALITAVDDVVAAAKSKRARKPKAEMPTPQAGLDTSLAPADRTARMAAMGFRKISRRG
jgi:hypothetical protein